MTPTYEKDLEYLTESVDPISPQSIIDGAITLIKKYSWRKGLYTSKNKEGKLICHTHDMPCFMCHTKLLITGLTVSDALTYSFNVQQRPFPMHAGFDRAIHMNYEFVLHEAKCLLARMDPSIRLREFDTKDGFLYPLYIDLHEWNDRKDQTKEYVMHVLSLALAGNIPIK